MNKIFLEETDSTNRWASEHCRELENMTYVEAAAQTAGRGQRGNSWESEPGKNLTFSVMFRPDSFAARRQFVISEAVALAIVETLAHFRIDASVKWPNDIYVGDRKICGILIEHSVLGMEIAHTVIGAGLNVNQTVFLSDAPNPTSMAAAADTAFSLDEVREELCMRLESHLSQLAEEGGQELTHQEYMRNLWRGDGAFHDFQDAASGEIFKARICDVRPEGYLVLEDIGEACRRYAFKEVRFIL